MASNPQFFYDGTADSVVSKMISGTEKILHLTTVHAPGDVRIGKEIRALQNAGFSVTLAARGDESTVFPTDFPIIKLSVYKNKVQRLLFSTLTALRVSQSFAIIHFHDPELIPAGFILRLFGKKVIYDVHEDYAAQIEDKEWIPKRVRKLAGFSVRFLERTFHRTGGYLVTATPHIANLFGAKRNVQVRNLPELKHWPTPLSVQERTVPVAFVGEIRPVRGAFVLQKTAGILFEKHGIRIVVAGKLAGMSEQEKSAFKNEPGLDYRGQIPYSEAVGLMRRIKVGLVPFLAAKNNVSGLPTKILEHFAAGSPVIMSDFPTWRTAFGQSGAAFYAEAGNAEDFADNISELLKDQKYSDRSLSARLFVEQHNHWEIDVPRLLECYKNSPTD